MNERHSFSTFQDIQYSSYFPYEQIANSNRTNCRSGKSASTVNVSVSYPYAASVVPTPAKTVNASIENAMLKSVGTGEWCAGT